MPFSCVPLLLLLLSSSLLVFSLLSFPVLFLPLLTSPPVVSSSLLSSLWTDKVVESEEMASCTQSVDPTGQVFSRDYSREGQ